MAVGWRIVERTPEQVLLAADDAALLIESPRPLIGDVELRDVIARLAPHLAFGPASSRGHTVERIAASGHERVVVGRCTRGPWSVAYVLASREPIDIDDVVAAHVVAPASPFDHFMD